MAGMEIPQSLDWELLVVTNNCTDNTTEVVHAFGNRLPVRVVNEPHQGLAHARNRAVQSVDGDYVVWTDDDVIVDRRWLTAYHAAFNRWPEAAVFGGPINPIFDGTPPAWLERVLPRISGFFATRDLGPESIPLSVLDNHLPFGANYAVRTAEQRLHPYNTELGRSAARALVGNEEIDVLVSILGSGHTGRWVPDARLEHLITQERQTTRYVRDYCVGYGVFLSGQLSPGSKLNQQVEYSLLRRALSAELRYRARRLLSRPEKWIVDLIDAGQAWGLLRGYRVQSKKDPGTSGSTS
jgi:glycosyltransferase involved in cell wall biosynthesis